MHYNTKMIGVCLFIAATLSTIVFGDAAWIDGNKGWLNNGIMKVGVDSAYGGSIVYVSHADSSTNLVNIHDHGRLIQQSYYAGRTLNRQSEGQHPSWSPWSWNPIQGGSWNGQGSITLTLKVINDGTTLFSETQPRLWDMNGELAKATMQQWMRFEPGMNNVVRVDNRLICWRDADDIWGPPVFRHQECPAVYLIRNMSKVAMYDGDEPWQNKPLTIITEHQPAPPWTKHTPTEHWVACVYPSNDFGVGVYSTYDDQFWYVGAVGSAGGGATASATMHVAAIHGMRLDRKTVWSYTYWLMIGDINTIRARAYQLHNRPAPLPPPSLSDLNRDGRMDIHDLTIFGGYWLRDDCDGPCWCGGADITRSGRVGAEDLAVFADDWLSLP